MGWMLFFSWINHDCCSWYICIPMTLWTSEFLILWCKIPIIPLISH
jgi:hypothetical protein